MIKKGDTYKDIKTRMEEVGFTEMIRDELFIYHH